MSKDYHPDKETLSSGSASLGPSSRQSTSGLSPLRTPRPQCVIAGSGSISASAVALQAILDDDSGYGTADTIDGSDNNQESIQRWHAGLTPDIPIHRNTSAQGGVNFQNSEHERRVLASHVHQLYYNQNRVALGRAITRTVETLKNLQDINATWPAHYPSLNASYDPSSSRPDPRPGINHTQSTIGDFTHFPGSSRRRLGLKRAITSLGEDSSAESSTAIPRKLDLAPETLITSQAAQDFSILKLDLKLEGLTQTQIAHSMDRRAIASLLDGRIHQSIRHLLLLRDRIEDTSSKVLVTGDLNAGKSTFCNALLRRKVLPEDQQPCTSIFCEVLDARENGGLEEVHAVRKEMFYNRHDESTYDVYTLQELEKIVTDNDQYNQCKVYIKDIRSIDQSLLNNGVVDISIIDAPGLNSDSLKTTAVFARQEEIDVVVFVVSAANHFTLSAKEFIWNAAHEKAYIFIVVNGFDNIRDKERCRRMVLEQVATLSPRTYKESAELVHFVSSNAIPVVPATRIGPGGGDGGSGAGGSGEGPDPLDDGTEPTDDTDSLKKHGEPGSTPGKGKGKEKEQLQDFEELEGALRRFVLEKRARSKLAPAKTYLLNILTDLNQLAVVNHEIAQSEFNRVTNELTELEPVYEQSKKARSEVSDDVERTIDSACTDIYNCTRETLNTTITRVADTDLGILYPGLFNAFRYAEDLKSAMLDEISAAVTICEEDARVKTVNGVSTIDSLGVLHLDDKYEKLSFRSDIMFRSKRHNLTRQVDTQIEIWDFFDPSSLWERQEKVAGTGMAMTVIGVLGGRLVGGVGWFDGVLGAANIMGFSNVRRLIVPGLITTGT